MTAAIFLVGLLASLFALSYFTKRRFGVLGLTLAAGALLSANWAGTLTPFIEQQGIVLVSPPLAALVEATLILLPPILLMFSGPSYDKPMPRLLGSLAFAVLAITFLLEPLGQSLRFDDASLQIYSTLSNYQSMVIVAGLIAAIVDVFLTRNPRRKSGH
ncbi:MAG: hypothetical protein ACREGJ_05020 [Candidatus Saccharimonadales bacterium]